MHGEENTLAVERQAVFEMEDDPAEFTVKTMSQLLLYSGKQ